MDMQQNDSIQFSPREIVQIMPCPIRHFTGFRPVSKGFIDQTLKLSTDHLLDILRQGQDGANACVGPL